MIRAKYGNKVKVRVHFVDIEYSGPGCPFDDISFYDGCKYTSVSNSVLHHYDESDGAGAGAGGEGRGLFCWRL